MTNEEYNQLFNDIQKKEQNGFGVSENHIPNNTNNQNQMLTETPNYASYNNTNSLNETPTQQYDMDKNINDGWNQNFQFETRVNGEVINNQINGNYQYQRKQKEDLNGLNQFVDENINEIYKAPLEPTQINEKIEDQDVVSLDFFNKIGQNAMLTLRQKFI